MHLSILSLDDLKDSQLKFHWVNVSIHDYDSDKQLWLVATDDGEHDVFDMYRPAKRSRTPMDAIEGRQASAKPAGTNGEFRHERSHWMASSPLVQATLILRTALMVATGSLVFNCISLLKIHACSPIESPKPTTIANAPRLNSGRLSSSTACPSTGSVNSTTNASSTWSN